MYVEGSILTAYLLGSVPFGLLIGRSRGVDIRHRGSGNIGATNLARALGRRWGILAFCLDYLKGLAPTLLAVQALLKVGAQGEPGLAPAGGWPSWLPVAVGAAAILGHVFPIFLRFRGGKGVATAFGVMTALSWPATLAAGAVWLVVYALTRTVSLASLTGAVTLPIATLAMAPKDHDATTSITGFAVAVAALILIRHRSNLGRLLRGEEFRFR